MRNLPLVGIAIVAALLGASATREVTAQGKAEDQARLAREKYDQGTRAYGEKKFEAVVSLMNEAIKLDNKEKVSGAFGRGYDYFPYFYLGQASRQLDRCGPALDGWEESHRQEMVSRRERHADAIQEGYAFCVGRGFLLGEQRNQATARVDKILSQAEANLGGLLARAGGWPQELQERLRKAQAGLNEARQLWRTAVNGRHKQQFDDAQRRAEESQKNLASIESDSLKPVEPRRSEGDGRSGRGNETKNPPTPPPIPQELVDKAEGAFAAAERRFSVAKTDLAKLGPEAASAATGDLSAVETGLAEWRRDLKAAFDPPDLEKYKILADTPPAIRRSLNRLRALLTGGTAPLSEEFQAGVELFFTGRYEQAVSALTEDLAGQVPDAVKPDFYALRAAANFALYERSGRAVQSESRKIMAIEDVRQCKTLKADFRPDLKAFSPRFIEFFASIPIPK